MNIMLFESTRAPLSLPARVTRYFGSAGERAALVRYYEFLLLVFRPINNEADHFYVANREAIELVAAKLRALAGYQQRRLYRGILLRAVDLTPDGELIPLSHIRYLSFSEDRSVAEYFADRQSPMNSFLSRRLPDGRGYIIEHEAPAAEVLFSWRWADVLGLTEQIITGDNAALLKQQQEVVIRQMGKRFRAVPLSLNKLSDSSSSAAAEVAGPLSVSSR